ncbi:hypothetical protein VNO77_33717 [Canavalia gladiata]|uniref:Uncharacterized protein n=1 Tax=Canavalia gladiata TaxID=3824 RepID=A0AAN9PYL6_CANGL
MTKKSFLMLDDKYYLPLAFWLFELCCYWSLMVIDFTSRIRQDPSHCYTVTMLFEGYNICIGYGFRDKAPLKTWNIAAATLIFILCCLVSNTPLFQHKRRPWNETIDLQPDLRTIESLAYVKY